MQYRVIGESDLSVSVIGYGCWGIAGGPMWGRQDEKVSIRALQTALDAGINFFDTAELYGSGYSEEVLGKALNARRDQAIIASKVLPTNLDRESLVTACENSLSRLGMETIDLYQVHWPEPPGEPDEVVETLISLRDAGKVRYFGVSNFGPVDLARYPEKLFVSNQVAYSLLFRASEYVVNPETVERGMSILTYSSLLHGILAGQMKSADDVPENRARTRHFSMAREFTRHGEAGHEELTFRTLGQIRQVADETGIKIREIALRWLMSKPGVASVLVGSRSPEQARSNAEIGAENLDDELVAKLDEITEPLKEAMGPNPDMWQSESRIRW